LISTLTTSESQDLIYNGTIKGVIIPKVRCSLEALKGGVNKCHIIDGRKEHAILLEVFTKIGIGTEIIH
jgi:acetylglutamate kinase